MNKKFSRIFALAIALTMCVALAVPAMAFEYDSLVVDENTEKNSTTFDKYLVLDDGALVPAKEFTFSIEPGDAVKADPKEGIFEIKAGPMGENAPSVSNAVFTVGQDTYTTVQTGDTLDLDEGKAYASSVVTVDFSGVTFTEPGVYRYVIKETSVDGNGFTVDPAPRYLDVYVMDDNGALKIDGYILLGTASNITTTDVDRGSQGYEEGVAKSTGFVNFMETYDLTIGKLIDGNQGNKKDVFDFTVTIKNATPGAYTVTYTPEDTHDNPTAITVDENGEFTGTFKLGHNETLTIADLNYGVKWSIKEDERDYAASVMIVGDEDASVTGDSAVAGKDGLIADTTVTFRNTREGVIPTGVLLTIAPFAALMLVGIAGVIFFTVKKRGSAK